MSYSNRLVSVEFYKFILNPWYTFKLHIKDRKKRKKEQSQIKMAVLSGSIRRVK
jgi:hypothetical protein